MSETQTRTPAGVPTGGQFAASAKAEASVDLADPRAAFPRAADGTIDANEAVKAGLISGFNTEVWAEPREMSFHGHWDGNTLVIESFYDGDVADDRPETYYWSEGLWADSATGTSEADIAATMLDGYEQCHDIRVAMDHEMTPDETEECAADGCDDDLSDNEGYDGYCGRHADLIEAHENGDHEDAAEADCPEC